MNIHIKEHANAPPQGAYPFALTASDLDGTLLDENQEIHPINVAAVSWAHSQAPFVLASGRISQQMLPYHKQLGLNEPIVACNGAHVFVPGGDVIRVVGIPADVAKAIYKLASSKRITALSYFEEGVSVTSKNYWSDDSDRHITEGTVEVTFCRATRLHGRSPLKIIFSASKKRIAALFADVNDRFGSVVSVLKLNDETIEFMALGVDKQSGLEAAANYLGIDRENIAAFGDGSNDATMLKWAGMGVAMNHGGKSAKAAARIVAPISDPATNFAAGLYAAVEAAGGTA